MNERLRGPENEPRGCEHEDESSARETDDERRAETERQPDEVAPAIWVASLSDYVNGRLHGAWIDADQEPEALQAEVNAMLAASPDPGAEEWAIFDFDGFRGLRLPQIMTPEEVSVLARAIAEHGEAFALWAEDVGAAEAAEHGDESVDLYIGRYDGQAAFAEEMWSDLGFDGAIDAVVPEALRYYVTIDFDGMARDMRLGGDVEFYDASGGGVHVIRSL